MKKLFLPAFLTLATVLFFSCKDNDDPINNGGSTTITNDEALALVNAIYGPLQTLSSSYSFLLESATETTISFEETDDSKDGPQVSILETTSSNWYPIKVFNRLYKSIGAANLAIDTIGAANVNSNLTQENKDLYVARAQFIRGYNYFRLVQLFGEVPVILNSVPSPTESTVRKSIDEVYEQAVSDLTEAAKKLPAYDATKSNPTQGAANTILAKIYLTWGQKPLSQSEVEAIKTSKTDPAKPAPDTEKLQLAVDYANKVIESGNYRLLADFNKIWGVNNENNDEVIFAIQHFGDGIDAQGNHQTHCGFTWPKEARKDPHLSYSDITYENAISEEFDSRKLYSYVTKVNYQDGVVDTLTWPISIVRPGKWIHRVEEGTNLAADNQPNSIDHIDYRYSEVLLIKAEALFFSGKSSEALTVINEIRQRAFGGHYDEHGGRLTTLTEEDLYAEWEYELAHEQKHWLNLVRWRTYLSTVLTKVPTFEYYKEEYATETSIKAAFPEVANSVNAPFYARIHKHLRAKVNNINGHFTVSRFP